MATAEAEVGTFPLRGFKLPSGWGAKLLRKTPDGDEETPQMSSAVMKQIPDEMWNKVESDLLNYIDEELNLCSSERWPFFNKVARWRVAYEAPLPNWPKNFPIANASNLTVPLIKENVNTIAAQLVQANLTARPYWMVDHMADEWEPFTDEIQKFLDIGAERDLDIDQHAVPWIIEAAKLGTSVVEVGHEIDERKIYQYTPDGRRAFPRILIKHDGPKMRHIALEDFWIRLSQTDIQEAPWVAKRVFYTEKTLREKEKIEKFFGIKELVDFYNPPEIVADKTKDAIQKAVDLKPLKWDLYEVFEIWVSWDVDGDGRKEELVLYYNRDAKKIIGRLFAPYWHGLRPFVKIGYFPREHFFYDEGLAEMLESLQAEISAQHNIRMDNSAMANIFMILKRRMEKGIMPGDPLYMGKVIEANDVWNSYREFKLSEPYPSTINNEMLSRQIADRVSGMNEATAGAAMPVTRTTAWAQMALLQEQMKRIDLTVRSIRKGLNQVGFFHLHMYYQFGTNGKGLAWMGERGRVIEALFRMPKLMAEAGLAIKAGVPTSAANQQVKRENSIQIFNLLVQAHEQLLPMAQAFAPDALPEIARALVGGARRFLGDALESFDSHNPDEILKGLAIMEQILPKAEDLGGLESYTRGAETSALLDRISRLEDLYRESAASTDGRQRTRPSSRDVRGTPTAEGVPARNGTSFRFGSESLFRR